MWTNLPIAFYLTGVLLGLSTMLVGQGLYSRYVGKVKPDGWWLLKISLLSWVAVILAMMLVAETWRRRNENTGNSHIEERTND